MSLRFATEPRASRRLLGRQDPQDLLDRRMPWIMGGMALWALLILLRLLWLQGVEHKRYRAKADQQHTTLVPVPPIRGELRDRRGEPLAISIKVESLFVDPRVFYPTFRPGKGEERYWGEPDRRAATEMAAKLAPISAQLGVLHVARDDHLDARIDCRDPRDVDQVRDVGVGDVYEQRFGRGHRFPRGPRRSSGWAKGPASRA